MSAAGVPKPRATEKLYNQGDPDYLQSPTPLPFPTFDDHGEQLTRLKQYKVYIDAVYLMKRDFGDFTDPIDPQFSYFQFFKVERADIQNSCVLRAILEMWFRESVLRVGPYCTERQFRNAIRLILAPFKETHKADDRDVTFYLSEESTWWSGEAVYFLLYNYKPIWDAFCDCLRAVESTSMSEPIVFDIISRCVASIGTCYTTEVCHWLPWDFMRLGNFRGTAPIVDRIKQYWMRMVNKVGGAEVEDRIASYCTLRHFTPEDDQRSRNYAIFVKRLKDGDDTAQTVALRGLSILFDSDSPMVLLPDIPPPAAAVAADVIRTVQPSTEAARAFFNACWLEISTLYDAICFGRAQDHTFDGVMADVMAHVSSTYIPSTHYPVGMSPDDIRGAMRSHAAWIFRHNMWDPALLDTFPSPDIRTSIETTTELLFPAFTRNAPIVFGAPAINDPSVFDIVCPGYDASAVAASCPTFETAVMFVRYTKFANAAVVRMKAHIDAALDKRRSDLLKLTGRELRAEFNRLFHPATWIPSSDVSMRALLLEPGVVVSSFMKALFLREIRRSRASVFVVEFLNGAKMMSPFESRERQFLEMTLKLSGIVLGRLGALNMFDSKPSVDAETACMRVALTDMADDVFIRCLPLTSWTGNSSTAPLDSYDDKKRAWETGRYPRLSMGTVQVTDVLCARLIDSFKRESVLASVRGWIYTRCVSYLTAHNTIPRDLPRKKGTNRMECPANCYNPTMRPSLDITSLIRDIACCVHYTIGMPKKTLKVLPLPFSLVDDPDNTTLSAAAVSQLLNEALGRGMSGAERTFAKIPFVYERDFVCTADGRVLFAPTPVEPSALDLIDPAISVQALYSSMGVSGTVPHWMSSFDSLYRDNVYGYGKLYDGLAINSDALCPVFHNLRAVMVPVGILMAQYIHKNFLDANVVSDAVFGAVYRHNVFVHGRVPGRSAIALPALMVQTIDMTAVIGSQLRKAAVHSLLGPHSKQSTFAPHSVPANILFSSVFPLQFCTVLPICVYMPDDPMQTFSCACFYPSTRTIGLYIVPLDQGSALYALRVEEDRARFQYLNRLLPPYEANKNVNIALSDISSSETTAHNNRIEQTIKVVRTCASILFPDVPFRQITSVRLFAKNTSPARTMGDEWVLVVHAVTAMIHGNCGPSDTLSPSSVKVPGRKPQDAAAVEPSAEVQYGPLAMSLALGTLDHVPKFKNRALVMRPDIVDRINASFPFGVEIQAALDLSVRLHAGPAGPAEPPVPAFHADVVADMDDVDAAAMDRELEDAIGNDALPVVVADAALAGLVVLPAKFVLGSSCSQRKRPGSGTNESLGSSQSRDFDTLDAIRDPGWRAILSDAFDLPISVMCPHHGTDALFRFRTAAHAFEFFRCADAKWGNGEAAVLLNSRQSDLRMHSSDDDDDSSNAPLSRLVGTPLEKELKRFRKAGVSKARRRAWDAAVNDDIRERVYAAKFRTGDGSNIGNRSAVHTLCSTLNAELYFTDVKNELQRQPVLEGIRTNFIVAAAALRDGEHIDLSRLGEARVDANRVLEHAHRAIVNVDVAPAFDPFAADDVQAEAPLFHVKQRVQATAPVAMAEPAVEKRAKLVVGPYAGFEVAGSRDAGDRLGTHDAPGKFTDLDSITGWRLILGDQYRCIPSLGYEGHQFASVEHALAYALLKHKQRDTWCEFALDMNGIYANTEVKMWPPNLKSKMDSLPRLEEAGSDRHAAPVYVEFDRGSIRYDLLRLKFTTVAIAWRALSATLDATLYHSDKDPPKRGTPARVSGELLVEVRRAVCLGQENPVDAEAIVYPPTAPPPLAILPVDALRAMNEMTDDERILVHRLCNPPRDLNPAYALARFKSIHFPRLYGEMDISSAVRILPNTYDDYSAYVCDDTVNYYFNLLQERQLQTDGDHDSLVLFLPSSFARPTADPNMAPHAMMEIVKNRLTVIKAERVPIHRLKQIYFPIHFASIRHWALGKIDLRANTIAIADSYNTPDPEIAAVRSRLTAFLKVAYVLASYKSPNYRQVTIDTFEQTQSDCGVFTVLNADRLSREYPVSHYSDTTAAHFREYIALVEYRQGAVGALNYHAQVVARNAERDAAGVVEGEDDILAVNDGQSNPPATNSMAAVASALLAATGIQASDAENEAMNELLRNPETAVEQLAGKKRAREPAPAAVAIEYPVLPVDARDNRYTLAFYSKSKDGVPPGYGAQELRPSDQDAQYTPLREIPDWRRVLSNFYLQDITFDDLAFSSVEHAFHYAKMRSVGTAEGNNRAAFLLKKTGSDTSKDPALARSWTSRANWSMTAEQLLHWNSVSAKVMRDLFYAKFSGHSKAYAVLMRTNDAKLVHITPRSKGSERWVDLEHLRDSMRVPPPQIPPSVSSPSRSPTPPPPTPSAAHNRRPSVCESYLSMPSVCESYLSMPSVCKSYRSIPSIPSTLKVSTDSDTDESMTSASSVGIVDQVLDVHPLFGRLARHLSLLPNEFHWISNTLGNSRATMRLPRGARSVADVARGFVEFADVLHQIGARWAEIFEKLRQAAETLRLLTANTDVMGAQVAPFRRLRLDVVHMYQDTQRMFEDLTQEFDAFDFPTGPASAALIAQGLVDLDAIILNAVDQVALLGERVAVLAALALDMSHPPRQVRRVQPPPPPPPPPPRSPRPGDVGANGINADDIGF
jgi:predicted NAD-dependent protein-ADP-ribosyltransferase YbiA (DUF1768 family)